MSGTGTIPTTPAVRRAALTAVAIPSAIAVVAIGFGLPEWLSLGLLALAPLLTAVWVLVALRPRAAAPASPLEVVVEALPEAAPRALGYVVREPGDPEFERRRDAIREACAKSGLTLLNVVHDTAAPGAQRAQPSLQWALARIAAGEADTLVVARLVDLSPSVASLSPLLRWFLDGARALIALDLDLDTSTPEGRLAAEAVAGVGTWERERISARTRRGLEAARSRGARQGRHAVADVPELHDRIAQMREMGMTLQAIADVLNSEGVPTLRGGTMWRPSSVQRAAGYRRPSTATVGPELPRAPKREERRRRA